MMKQLSLLALCLSIMSCNFMQSKSETKKTEPSVITAANPVTLNINQVMEVAADKVGQEISFKGVVNHVCAHSGKRCILKNAEGNLKRSSISSMDSYTGNLILPVTTRF